MAYVIAAPCIADYSCIEICPVDCISPGPKDKDFDDAEQMYINPEVCINCGACVDACPVLAIYSDDCLPSKWRHYAQINREYFAKRK
jgi:ferredoxin